jgi:hypothetical protein
MQLESLQLTINIINNSSYMNRYWLTALRVINFDHSTVLHETKLSKVIFRTLSYHVLIIVPNIRSF